MAMQRMFRRLGRTAPIINRALGRVTDQNFAAGITPAAGGGDGAGSSLSPLAASAAFQAAHPTVSLDWSNPWLHLIGQECLWHYDVEMQGPRSRIACNLQYTAGAQTEFTIRLNGMAGLAEYGVLEIDAVITNRTGQPVKIGVREETLLAMTLQTSPTGNGSYIILPNNKRALLHYVVAFIDPANPANGAYDFTEGIAIIGEDAVS